MWIYVTPNDVLVLFIVLFLYFTMYDSRNAVFLLAHVELISNITTATVFLTKS